MEKEDLIKNVLQDDEDEILELLFENAENDGTIMTPKNRKGLIKYRKRCDEKMLEYYKCLNIGCKKNETFKNDLEKKLDDYKSAMMEEHNYYNSCYYKQRNERWDKVNYTYVKIKIKKYYQKNKKYDNIQKSKKKIEGIING